MIFSLDPGVSRIGWAIIDASDETIVSLGSIGYPPGGKEKVPLNKRMNALVRNLIDFYTEILDIRDIDKVAWEIVPSFGAMNNRELVQACAITLKVLAAQRDLPYQQMTSRSWKKDLVGNGSSNKEEVKQWLLDNKKERPLPDDAPYDSYDACGIGIVAARRDSWTLWDEIV